MFATSTTEHLDAPPTRVVHHRGEDALWSREEVLGSPELGDQTLVEDQDLVVVDDGVQPVSDRQDGAVFELCAHRALDDCVGLDVYVCGGLVEDEDPGGVELGPGEREELSLAGAEGRAPLLEKGVEAGGPRLDDCGKTGPVDSNQA